MEPPHKASNDGRISSNLSPTARKPPTSLWLRLLEARLHSLLSQEAVLLCSVGVLQPHCRTGSPSPCPTPWIIHSRLTLKNRPKPVPPGDTATFISSGPNQLTIAASQGHWIESTRDTAFHSYRFTQGTQVCNFYGKG